MPQLVTWRMVAVAVLLSLVSLRDASMAAPGAAAVDLVVGAGIWVAVGVALKGAIYVGREAVARVRSA